MNKITASDLALLGFEPTIDYGSNSLDGGKDLKFEYWAKKKGQMEVSMDITYNLDKNGAWNGITKGAVELSIDGNYLPIDHIKTPGMVSLLLLALGMP